MSNVNVIRIIAGLVFAGTFLVIAVFYLGLLARILKKCSPPTRTMEPGLVWLLLIPLVSSIWIFFVVIALAKSLGNEFRLRNIPADNEPGKSIGIGMAVCGACSFIPIVNLLTGPIAFVLWIVYWVKMAGYSKMLDAAPANPSAATLIPGV